MAWQQRGRWWLVGAPWKKEEQEREDQKKKGKKRQLQQDQDQVSDRPTTRGF